MSSDGVAPAAADVELLNAYKVKAEARFRAGETRAYTSPKAIWSFLGQRMPELSAKERCDHELLLVESQTYKDADTNFVSTVCGTCRHHFHFKSNEPSPLVRQLDEGHPQHMLLAYDKKGLTELDEQRCQNRHDNSYGSVNFICCDRDCLFSLEIIALLPRLTIRDVGLFQDQGRVRANLVNARRDDPERYADVDNDYGAQPAGTMVKYLSDHLDREPAAGPLKIKKRNKRFMVSFSTDFDPLLRSLGWEEREDQDEEACWFLPLPTSSEKPTRTKTLEAQYEDARTELMICFSTYNSKPAWERLLRVFQGHHEASPSPQSFLSQIQETDLSLLGCLVEDNPTVFAWAAILLANIDPRRRLSFTRAALNCILERNEAARDSIVIYESKFDPGSANESFEYFGTTPSAGNDEQYYIEKYRNIIAKTPSDDERARALSHLQVIERETSLQIINIMPSSMLKFQNSTAVAGADTMGLQAAAEFLGVEAGWPADLIRDVVHNLNETISRVEIARALESLASHKRSQGNPTDADALQNMASFLHDSEAGHYSLPEAERANSTLGTTHAISMDVPPGIKNVGNTCYLNSLLQYLYTLVPIRQLLDNFEEHKLELDEEHVSQRRCGSTTAVLKFEHAMVARIFAELLRELFAQLRTTNDDFVLPSRKLVEAALNTATVIMNKDVPLSTVDAKPPPLPARPSPAPPTPSSLDADMPTVRVEALDDHTGINSPTGSSQTLVNDMEPLPVVLSVDSSCATSSHTGAKLVGPDMEVDERSTKLTLLERLEDVERKLELSDNNSGAQQDVTEIMGHIFEHLSGAIKHSGTNPDLQGVQTDIITDLFHLTTVNHTIDLRKRPTFEEAMETASKEVSSESCMTVFPHPEKKVSRTIYEAIDGNLGFEVLDNTMVRYTSVRRLPPILHICIQRSGLHAKNEQPVVLPEILCMDRYLEADSGSDLDRLRRRMGVLQAYRAQLEARVCNDTEYVTNPVETSNQFSPPPSQADLGDEFDPTTPPNLNGGVFGDLSPIMSKRKRSDSSATSQGQRGIRDHQSANLSVEELCAACIGLIEDTRAKLQKVATESDAAFADLQKHKYAVHAIICHDGTEVSGHYWVWIRDYKRQVWLHYNDQTVTVDKRDIQTLLNELNKKGMPYWVAYVRDDQKHELVDVPPRAVPVGEGAIDGNETEDAEMEYVTLEGINPGTPGDEGVGGGSDIKQQATMQVHEVHTSDEPPPYEIL